MRIESTLGLDHELLRTPPRGARWSSRRTRRSCLRGTRTLQVIGVQGRLIDICCSAVHGNRAND
jgi:hypothetical protein